MKSGKNKNTICHLVAIILIAAASFAAYYNTISGEFIWDDRVLIPDNYHIKDWGNLFDNISSDFFFTSREEGKIGYYRPVITLSYMINYSLFKINPPGYHLTNIILHLLNGVLIYLLAVHLLGSLRISLLAALLFSVHPVHTESVSWIAGRTDVIACLFFLTSLYCYAKFVEKKGLFLYLISLLSFTFSLFSKEMAVTLPLILIAYDYFYTTEGKKEKLAERIRYWLPFFAVIPIFLFIKSAVLNIIMGNPHVASFGKFFTLLTFGKAIIYYLKKILWPFQLNAYVVLPFTTNLLSLSVFLSLTLFSFSLYFLLKNGHRFKGSSFSLAFFWISMMPISNLIPISAPFDMEFPTCERFLYIPSVGLSILGALALESLIRRFTSSLYHKVLLALLLLSLFSAYLFATLIRNVDWLEELHFYAKTSKSSPLAYIIHNNLGSTYSGKGMLDEAISELKKALAINPRYAKAYSNLGTAYGKKDRLDEAISEYRKAIAINPSFAEARNNLGLVYVKKGMLDEAISEYKKAHTINPDFAEAHNNMGIAYYKQGKLDKAISKYKKTLAMYPRYAEAHSNLAAAYYDKGMLDEAISELKKALAIEPRLAKAHSNLVVAYHSKGNYKLAIFHCDKAVKLGHNVNPKLLESLKPYR